MGGEFHILMYQPYVKCIHVYSLSLLHTQTCFSLAMGIASGTWDLSLQLLLDVQLSAVERVHKFSNGHSFVTCSLGCGIYHSDPCLCNLQSGLLQCAQHRAITWEHLETVHGADYDSLLVEKYLMQETRYSTADIIDFGMKFRMLVLTYSIKT